VQAEPPLPSPTEALAEAKALVTAAKLDEYLVHPEDLERARELGLSEAKARTLLAAMAAPCLAERARDAAACASLTSFVTAKDGDDLGKVVPVLVTYLGAVADPAIESAASTKLLVRLEARGVWRAGMAIDAILTRRAEAARKACAPPTESEIAAASSALGDFLLVEGGAAGKPASARPPSADELRDLAYFYASVAASGPEVASVGEDELARPLGKDDPAVTTRKELADGLRDALLDGDLARHLELAERYLGSLGYPGPIRAAEEGDRRWGGAGYSYVMRDAARSAELLGRLELAGALYRRAQPGGGACGTSVESRREDQIQGAVRVGEEAAGCRAVVPELLYAAGHVESEGPQRLEQAGFDVIRLYRGALLTRGRSDRETLERALSSVPALAEAARERAARLGNEDWARRVRAVEGFADTARKGALERLFSIAESGTGDDRVRAVGAIGDLVESHGDDPCDPASLYGWGGGGSSGEREIRSVMHACEGSLSAAERRTVADRLAKLGRDPEGELRAAVAAALGKTAEPTAEGSLRRLLRDTWDTGGRVCRTVGDKPEVCQPNRPVRLAAEDGLEALQAAERLRREQRSAHHPK
jgi:hypothetical protein